jgi:hypothetical protein
MVSLESAKQTMVSCIHLPLLLSHAQMNPSAQGFAGWLHAVDEPGAQLAPAEASTQPGAASTPVPPSTAPPLVPPVVGRHSIPLQRQTSPLSQPHCIALQSPAAALSQSISPHVQPLPHAPALHTLALIG